MQLRGIRGATTVNEDRPEEILRATRELLQQMQKENAFTVEEVIKEVQR